MRDAPRIYVACLAAYNAGELYGEWFEVPEDPDELADEIDALLAGSPAHGEEWAVHASEGFCGIRLPDHPPLEELCRTAAFVQTHGALGAALFATFGTLDEAEVALAERYLGAFDSDADWAADYLAETGALALVPEMLRPHIDFGSYAHDLELGGDLLIVLVEGTRHFFWSR